MTAPHWPDLPGVRHEQLHAGGIDVHVALAGPDDGPPVLLLHGFPELWFAWRHQLQALGDAGYRVIAPDLRGVGGTAAPANPDTYDLLHLVRDAIGVLDALYIERAVMVGHDWGAPPAWWAAAMHPFRVHAVAGLSVPMLPRGDAAPVPIMREHLGEDFYIVHFQEPGVAEAMLERDVRRTLTTTEQWSRSWGEVEGDDPPCPPFLTEDELAVFVEAYTRTGFTGGLNWYRNLDRNQRVMVDWDGAKVTVPALFIQGSRDPVAGFMPAAAMDGLVTDLRVEIVDGAGHWVQQQEPDIVNALLLGFLREVRW
ncbi:Epoxide hydrolase A [Paraconexibacter sp. AEG42_29]|uniref:Epoxide hydrolase A n=1 Tax=Paraconexibacter sp. AEG42_29 TaxID=2997339 RepID=A0AAU7AY33_9ACTN